MVWLIRGRGKGGIIGGKAGDGLGKVGTTGGGAMSVGKLATKPPASLSKPPLDVAGSLGRCNSTGRPAGIIFFPSAMYTRCIACSNQEVLLVKVDILMKSYYFFEAT